MVMAVYAPDSKKSLEMHKECVSSVVKVLRESSTSQVTSVQNWVGCVQMKMTTRS